MKRMAKANGGLQLKNGDGGRGGSKVNLKD
jgi:hypothetical protein